MKKAFLIVSISIFFLSYQFVFSEFDLTIIGDVNYNSGMERIPISLMQMFHSDFAINHIAPLYIKTEGVSQPVKMILNNPDKSPGKVAILTNPIGYPRNNMEFYKKVPNSKIKIAYSMLESSAIPQEWVKVINNFFDAVVVPDKWLVGVYNSSGVKIPIFVIPVPLYLDNFLKHPSKNLNTKKKNFVFGCSAACSPGKNIEKLIHAFVKEFGKDENVFLKLHSRGGSRVKEVKELISKINNPRIIFDNSVLSQSDYIKFLADLDCYVQIAQGEGFSITPREALALGVPCIVSNNTTHQTICNSGCVYSLKADKPIPAYYDVFQKNIGNKFDCELGDVCRAMREVYGNYEKYFQMAQQGRIWVEQYLPERLKPIYKNLLKPQILIFDNHNSCTESFLCTNSLRLIKKYNDIFAGEFER